MNKEVWKPVEGYEGLYEISNAGRVKSVSRIVLYKSGFYHKNKGKIMKLTPCSSDKRCNYFRVSLSKNNQVKRFDVHRLVAEHFLTREKWETVVNHIDGNKQNNRVDNLEWTTPSGNKRHAVYTGLDIPKFGIKPVYCLTNGKVYPSASYAARELDLNDSSVAKVCRGVYKHTKGMVFRYAG
jgi:hypothetical protein